MIFQWDNILIKGSVYCKSHSHNVYTGKATLSFSQRSTEYSFPALTMQTSFPIGILKNYDNSSKINHLTSNGKRKRFTETCFHSGSV